MGKQFLLVVLCTIASLALCAQREASNWYFGSNAGIRFNSDGSITALDDGKLDTLEGCASISDRFGNLLFYTDGITVYDRNHDIMPGGTGLFGDPSSSQSAIIVPQPESTSIYYIFTVAALEPGETTEDNIEELRGFHFYTVDLDQGPTGTVINHGNGGMPLLQPNSEKITAVRSSDCSSIWVITQYLDTFYAFEVTSTGVTTTPVTSVTPLEVPFSGYRFNAIGYLKASPDGSKLLIAHSTVSSTPDSGAPGVLALYDFNTTTGEVTNEVILPSDGGRPYGVEFSPSNELAYASVDFISGSGNDQLIFQFDLLAPDIGASRVTVGTANGGALQLGPDGKIYHSNAFQRSLNVIENPNDRGQDADFRNDAISLGTRQSIFGLPPFIQSLFNEVINITGETNEDGVLLDEVFLCPNDSFTFVVSEPLAGATYRWFFDDGTIEVPLSCSGETCGITNAQPSDAGRYRVEIDPMDGSCPKEGFGFVQVIDFPASISATLTQCDVDSNTVDGITPFNLSEADDQLVGGFQGLEVLYYRSADDLMNDEPIENIVGYRNQNPFNQTLIVRLLSQAGCEDTGTLDLIVAPTTGSLPDLGTFYSCDEDPFDNVIESSFDLDQIRTDNYPPTLTITFFTSLEDASLELNPVSGNNFITSSTPIFVRLETANQCEGIERFDLVVDPAPRLEFPEEIDLCTNLLPKTLSAPFGFETYSWYRINGGETLVGDAGEVEIFEAGRYRLEVGFLYGNGSEERSCTAEAFFELIPSSIASIDQVIITDAKRNNTIAVEVSGDGDYEYALNSNGPYQEEPFFENVRSGFVTVYVRDRKGCGIAEKTVSVIGFPRFFTPNGDGYNDFWQVDGVSNQFQRDSEIIIFDRFGKLIKEVDPRSPGWDGTYNGRPLPSGGYWFSVVLQDGRDFTGYFTLIRRG